jgi:DNA-binding NtrC family response regulator
MARILLIDDDPEFSTLLGESLESHGHHVEWGDCPEPMLARLTRSAGDVDVVLLDNRMPRMNGIEFLEELRRREVRVPVLLMTGHGCADLAIRASKLGAFKFFPKPDTLDESLDRLLQLIGQAAGISRLSREPQPGERHEEGGDLLLLGRSEAMCEVYERIGSAALHDDPVLIEGESGTGKDLAARTLVRHSDRHNGPFLKVSCAAFDERRLEAELFGCEGDDLPGAFERAAGGALLLDEIGATSRPVQARLLQVLQEKVVARGGRRGERVRADVRLLATTSRDLRADIGEGRFDAELYYLLERVSIRMPPLRDRGADLVLLADHFLRLEAASSVRPVCSFDEAALEVLSRHPWPGNVRELRAVVRQALLLCRGDHIGPGDLRLLPRSADGPDDVSAFIRQAIRAGLHAGQGDAAAFLRVVFERELALVTGPGGMTAEEPSERRLPPSRLKAYQLFQWALEQAPELGDAADAVVFRWLQEDPRVAGEGLPDRSATFERYLRDARAYYNDHKNTPRHARSYGSSVVPATRV